MTESPVFVDESGRRSRRYRRIGIVAGMACAVYAVVMVATLLSGNSDAPWLPVPGQGEDKEAGRVEDSPRPAASAEPTGATGVQPADVPPPVGSTAPATSAPAATPGASADPEDPAPSVEPEPTVTATTPGTDPTVTPEESPDPPATGTPAPPTTAAPSITPPDPPAGDSGGGTGSGSRTVPEPAL
ncbi:hypothetical protein OHT76_17415 [Streptomyces sp. NBC_00287]|uniref:hypothetical protein n=1 Tax=Streptomyces sp. NBC_00287 TaxID=2975702 RepID=UPI002E2C9E97|nr:hypothetical protein [Streptomyces sp. NBC_00287]